MLLHKRGIIYIGIYNHLWLFKRVLRILTQILEPDIHYVAFTSLELMPIFLSQLLHVWIIGIAWLSS